MKPLPKYEPRRCNVLLMIYDTAALLEWLADEQRCLAHKHSPPTPRASKEQVEELIRLLNQDSATRSSRQRRHGRNLVK